MMKCPRCFGSLNKQMPSDDPQMYYMHCFHCGWCGKVDIMNIQRQEEHKTGTDEQIRTKGDLHGSIRQSR